MPPTKFFGVFRSETFPVEQSMIHHRTPERLRNHLKHTTPRLFQVLSERFKSHVDFNPFAVANTIPIEHSICFSGNVFTNSMQISLSKLSLSFQLLFDRIANSWRTRGECLPGRVARIPGGRCGRRLMITISKELRNDNRTQTPLINSSNHQIC